jgi:hypothetical protein
MKVRIIPSAFLALLILSGCAANKTVSLLPQPSLSDLSSAGSTQSVTAVDVTPQCRALAKRVAAPEEVVGVNVYVLWHKYRQALEVANYRLGATAECIARLSADYAQGRRPAGK